MLAPCRFRPGHAVLTQVGREPCWRCFHILFDAPCNLASADGSQAGVLLCCRVLSCIVNVQNAVQLFACSVRADQAIHN